MTCDSNCSGGHGLLVILPVALSMAWILFDLFYLSWLLGFVINGIVNLYLKLSHSDTGIHIGALRISVMTGRLLFKDLHYYTRDYTIRVTDGYATLRWWGRCQNGATGCCGHSVPHTTLSSASSTSSTISHPAARRHPALVFLQLNGFYWHWYNRYEVYDKWGKSKADSCTEYEPREDGFLQNLHRAIHFDFNKFRLVLGNHLLERSLVVTSDFAKGYYVASEASNPYDEQMHRLMWHGENVRATLEPSAGFVGNSLEQPPPTEDLPSGGDTGENPYLVFKTDSADITYTWDSPGLVPLGETQSPKYAVDATLGTNTVVNYGCYANRQRAALQKFFFPNDYTEAEVTEYPQPGMKRIYTKFDVSVQLDAPAVINVLFKSRDFSVPQSTLPISRPCTSKLIFRVGKDSAISISQPLTTDEGGSTTLVTGHLSSVKAQSSLRCRHLAKAEALQFSTDLHFPRVWNSTQTWDMNIKAIKVQVNILFSYIDFINDFLDDWVGTEPNDILNFVPIDWKICANLENYEIYFFTNRYNWIDEAKDSLENSRLAFCGTTGQLKFEFPFLEFLPQIQPISFSAYGQNVVVRKFIPASSSTKESTFALSASNKHRWRLMEYGQASAPDDLTASNPSTKTLKSKTISGSYSPSSRTKNVTGSVESAGTGHPRRATAVPEVEQSGEAPLTQLMEEDSREFFPMGYRGETRYEDGWIDFACGPIIDIRVTFASHLHDMESVVAGNVQRQAPSVMNVEIEAPTVMLRVFGFLAPVILALKENYPGEFINFTAYNTGVVPASAEPRATPQFSNTPPPKPDCPDEPAVRFVEVNVVFKLQNITAEFPTHLPEGYPRDFPLPSGCTNLLSLTVKYAQCETTAVLHLDPVTVHIPVASKNLSAYEMGHLTLSTLDFRCHGFTEFMCGERVEYAWLMQLAVGRITGACSVPQLTQVVDWLYTAAIHTLSHGDGYLEAPGAILIQPKVEPLSEAIKYLLFNLKIASLDLHLNDDGPVTRIQSKGLDVGLCGLHHKGDKLGLSFLLHDLSATCAVPLSSDHSCLLECGHLQVGDIQGDLSLRDTTESVPARQLAFLKMADAKTHRLWFLWAEGSDPAQCGCCGGCQFFDDSIRRPEGRSSTDPTEGLEDEGPPYNPMAIQSLKKVLPLFTIMDMECIAHLHQGLLDYTGIADPNPQNRTVSTEAKFYSVPTDHTSPSDSFVSANSSFLGEDGEEEKSAEPLSVASKKRHSKHVSDAGGNPRWWGHGAVEDHTQLYKDFASAHSNRLAVLHVPMKKGSGHTSLQGSPQVNLKVAGIAPPTSGSRLAEGYSTHHTPRMMVMKLPLLESQGRGHLPVVTERQGVKKHKEKRKTVDSSASVGGEGSLATVSLCISMCRNTHLAMSPLLLPVVERATRAVSEFFRTRSALAILDGVCNDSVGSVKDQLVQIRDERTFAPPPKASSPLLHLSVKMLPSAFMSLQLFQVPVDRAKNLNLRHNATQVLREIATHTSILTGFLSGVDVGVVVHNCTEVQGGGEGNTPTLENSPGGQPPNSPGEQPPRSRLNTFKVSATVRIPVTQASLSLVLSGQVPSLPSLSSAQSDLSFQLSLPSVTTPPVTTPTTGSGDQPILCNLLELGTKDVSASCVAHLFRSEVVEEAILLMDEIEHHSVEGHAHQTSVEGHAHQTPLEGHAHQTPVSSHQKVINRVLLSVSVPQVWCHMAAPLSGIPSDHSTGGLDVLVAMDIVEAWTPGFRALVSSVSKLFDEKVERDRHVLLALLSIANHLSLNPKPTTVLLSPLSLSLRNSAVYMCLTQLWHTMNAYTAEYLGTIGMGQPCDREIVALCISLSARIYLARLNSMQDTSNNRHGEMLTSYESISPAPSELALLNSTYSFSKPTVDVNFQEVFDKVEHGRLIVVKECLLPLFSSVGMRLAPQLRPSHANSYEVCVDFKAVLKEVAIFILECTPGHTPTSLPPPPPTSSPAPGIPAIVLSQLSVAGCVKAYQDVSSDAPSPSLLTNTGPNAPDQGRTTVSSQFCISLDSVSTAINVPLLRAVRHLIETGRLRSAWRRKRQKARQVPDLATSCVIQMEHNPVASQGRGRVQRAEVQEVWQFAQSIVGMLGGDGGGDGGGDDGGGGGGSQSDQDTTSGVPLPQPPEEHTTHPSVQTGPLVTNYRSNPGLHKSHGVNTRTSSDPIPILLPHSGLSDSSNQLNLAKGPPSTGTSTPTDSSDDGTSVAITIEDGGPLLVPSTDPSDHDLGTSPSNAHLGAYGAAPANPPNIADSRNGGDHPDGGDPQSIPKTPAIAVDSSSRGVGDSEPVTRSLALPERELLFSVYGLLKVNSVEFTAQVESVRTVLELVGISGAVDVRKTAATSSAGPKGKQDASLSESLPTYLSLATTIKRSSLRVTDRVAHEQNELVSFSALPIHSSVGVSNMLATRPPSYRCLVKLVGVELDVKQSPVMVHTRFKHLMPSFIGVYNDIFFRSQIEDPSVQQSVPVFTLANLKMTPHLPCGFVHLSLDKAVIVMAPLPSLTITYNVSPINAQVESSGGKVNFSLVVGFHSLRFNPKEHKDELAIRGIPLPAINFDGDVKAYPPSKLPRFSVDLSIKQVNVELTTDVLNQLLILQNSFIKEINELAQLFVNIGDYIPNKERVTTTLKRETVAEPIEFVSLLHLCKFSIQGVCITVSTPLSTAVRFYTGKIEMLIVNTSVGCGPLSEAVLSLSGKVDIDISLALGYLQDTIPDADDFFELAYFRTRVSIRNTQQNMLQEFDNALNLPQENPQQGSGNQHPQQGSGDKLRPPAVAQKLIDTFIISINSPHLYVQSTAVEQAILFWLNCKSVYAYWQNKRKRLNIELIAATQAFFDKFHMPAHSPTTSTTATTASSFDFPKPRHVQISVTDAGVCMPLASLPTTPQSTQKAFPALVMTVKEMQLYLNLSRKVASSGKFSGYCVRFAEQFYIRHKTWTLDHRKHKFTNCGFVHEGTFRLCVATKPRDQPADGSPVSPQDKLLVPFQWHMAGIEVNANTEIGHHLSSLVKTMTAIGSDLETRQYQRMKQPSFITTIPGRSKHHKRALSVLVKPNNDSDEDSLEVGLALQTRRVQKLKHSGATGESLRSEQEALHQMELDLAYNLKRVFKKGKIHQLGFLFSSPSAPSNEHPDVVRQKRLSAVVTPTRRRPASKLEHSEEDASDESGGGDVGVPIPRPKAQTISGRPTHTRNRSDISDLLQSFRKQSPTPDVRQAEDTGSPIGQASSTPSIGAGSNQPPMKEEDSIISSIDIEINLTIHVDSGVITLHYAEDNERRGSMPAGTKYSSPLLTRNTSNDFNSLAVGKGRTRDPSIKTPSSVLLIPALEFKAHYHSVVGKRPPRVPMPTPAPSHSPPSKEQSIPPTHPDAAMLKGSSLPSVGVASHGNLPAKKGMLSLSATISSLPSDVELTPSILEFIEQIAKPTIAATNFNSSSNESELEEEEEEEEVTLAAHHPATTETNPISFPVDVIIMFNIQPSTVQLSCKPQSRVQCLIQSPNVHVMVSFSLFSQEQLEVTTTSDSISSHLAELTSKTITFNNFHVTACLTTFALQLYSPQAQSLREGEESKSDNKEALSLTLGHALIHLSRKSVLAPSLRRPFNKITSVDDYTMCHKMQVSIIGDIASLVVGYDMRRLNDVTAFRRYWYRTSLVEAIFIGSKKKPGPGEEGPLDSSQEAAGGKKENNNTGTGGKEEDEGVQSQAPHLDDSISATIAVAVNIADFRISANVAQVMGNTDLLVTHLRLEGHADVLQNELILLSLDSCLEKGEVEARGGIVAGSILMEKMTLHVTTDSQVGTIPVHRAAAHLQLVEGKVDYMSSCILLARATNMNVMLHDAWEGLLLPSAVSEDSFREPSIMVFAEFTWDTLQVVINRATTRSTLNMVQKITEFIVQQKRRSERTISLMLPPEMAAAKALAAYREEQRRAEEVKRGSVQQDMRHHWLWAMKVGSVRLMQALGICVQDEYHNVSLGGKINISGENVCIVCFHGPSFRETEWVVFNVDYPKASFSTQAIPGFGSSGGVRREDEEAASMRVRICQQICALCLGEEDGAKLHELAAVYRVSNSSVPALTASNIVDWLSLVCIDHHLHPSKCAGAESKLIKHQRRMTVQPILSLPSFSVQLINDHFWPIALSMGATAEGGLGTPDNVPVVECSLNSQFSAGISVTTTVDHYLFLHDVIKGYIEYLEKHKSTVSTTSPSASPEPAEPLPPTPAPLSRQFISVWWQLDPQLQLLSNVASGQFNPHISWLLDKLGFKDAPTTIPKWIQRGAMDPLDMAVSAAVELLINLTATKKLQLKETSAVTTTVPVAT